MNVDFLNVEYILVRLFDVFGNWSINGVSWFLGISPETLETQGPNSPAVASHFLETLSFIGGQVALAGMSIAILMIAVCLVLRLRLEVMEHAGFHEREAKYHHAGHDEHNGSHESAHEESSNKARFDEVVALVNTPHESDWRRAIMEADIMLGEALEQQGYRGTTVGDRLKDANPLQMTTLDVAWQAHKVRNQIAHGGEGYHLSEWEARGTIDFYKRVFEELGFV